MITIKDVEAAWDLIRTADREAASLSDEILEHEGTQQDILHELELLTPPYAERAKLAQRLGKVRRKRRVAKDQYELLQPLVAWAAANPDAVKRFGEVVGQMRKITEKNSKRMYMCRGEERGRIIGK